MINTVSDGNLEKSPTFIQQFYLKAFTFNALDPPFYLAPLNFEAIHLQQTQHKQ